MPKVMKGFILTTLAAVLLVGCSGELTGAVYYSTKGGDVKRLGDHEIVLVAATEAFEKEWQEAREAYVVAMEPKMAAAEQARKEAAASSGYQEHLFDKAKEAAGEADKVRSEHLAHALKLVAWGKTASARTDVNGKYSVNVPRGRYYVYGRHNGAINDMTWFVTVAVGGTTTLDLTGSNASGWPF